MGVKTDKKYLLNEALSNTTNANLNVSSLHYSNNGDVVGVAFDATDEMNPFVAYRTNERGRVVVKRTFSSFESARQKAATMYSDLCFVTKKINEAIAKREEEESKKLTASDDLIAADKKPETIRRKYPGIKRTTYAGTMAYQLRSNYSVLQVGERVRVYVRSSYGANERLRCFEGTVKRIRGRGTSKSFTVCNKRNGVGIERIFPINSARIDHIDVIRKGVPNRTFSSKIRKQNVKAIRLKKG